MHDTRARGRLQGVRNIVRFNAPIYLAGLVTCVLGLGAWVGAPALVAALGPASLTPHEAERAAALARVLGASAALTALVLTLGTLVASYLTHDRSGLYTWVCLEPYLPTPLSRIAHVHTGLGESSASLRLRFPEAELHVFDASAPAAQPAPSIARARARRLVPLYPGTVPVGFGALPLPSGAVDLHLLPMAAHEVRDAATRARSMGPR